MKFLVMLLFAATTPALHPTTTVPHVVQSPWPTFEPERVLQDVRIADATVLLARMTFILAIVTAAAVIVPLIQRVVDRKRARRVALGQFGQILNLFVDRTSFLHEFPTEDARSLLIGLDSALTRALADDIGDALSPSDADLVYRALFSAHGALARAISQQKQALEDPTLSADIELSIKEDTQAGLDDLDEARRILRGLSK